MRYAGQWRSIAVPVEGTVTSFDDVVSTFEDEHEREHSYRREGSPIEIYRLNLRAIGVTRKAELPAHDEDGSLPDPSSTRQVRFEGDEAVETPVYRRDTLGCGVSFQGPAIVEQLDSTVVVPPGVLAEVDEYRNIRLTIEGSD
jgi:N-methylhydantoinase A